MTNAGQGGSIDVAVYPRSSAPSAVLPFEYSDGPTLISSCGGVRDKDRRTSAASPGCAGSSRALCQGRRHHLADYYAGAGAVVEPTSSKIVSSSRFWSMGLER